MFVLSSHVYLVMACEPHGNSVCFLLKSSQEYSRGHNTPFGGNTNISKKSDGVGKKLTLNDIKFEQATQTYRGRKQESTTSTRTQRTRTYVYC